MSEILPIPRNPRHRRAGMTLLELMIASGITATALVLLMGSLANVSATGASAEERAMAASHVASVMEEIRSMDRESLLIYQTQRVNGLRNSGVTVQYVSTNGDLVTLPVTLDSGIPAMPNPVEVRVAVTWQGKGGQRGRVDATTLYRW